MGVSKFIMSKCEMVLFSGGEDEVALLKSANNEFDRMHHLDEELAPLPPHPCKALLTSFHVLSHWCCLCACVFSPRLVNLERTTCSSFINANTCAERIDEQRHDPQPFFGTNQIIVDVVGSLLKTLSNTSILRKSPRHWQLG